MRGLGSLLPLLFSLLFLPLLHVPSLMYPSLFGQCFFFFFFPFPSLLGPPTRPPWRICCRRQSLSPKVSSSRWLPLSCRSHQTFHNLNLSLQVWSAWDYVSRRQPPFDCEEAGARGWGLCEAQPRRHVGPVFQSGIMQQGMWRTSSHNGQEINVFAFLNIIANILFLQILF